MAARAGGLRPSAPAVAAAVAILLLGFLGAWALNSHDNAAQSRRRSTASAAVVTVLDNRADRVVRALTGPIEALSILPAEQVPALVYVTSPGRVATRISGRLPAGLTPEQVEAGAQTAMEVARDTGDPQAAPERAGLVPIVAATYADGAGTASDASTGDRRRLITGWRIGLVSPVALASHVGTVTGLTGNDSDTGVVVDGQQLTGPRGASVVGSTLVAGQSWAVVAKLPDETSPGAIALLALAVVAAVALLLVDLRAQRSLRRERRSSAALERETKTVATLGPLLQSSLDLAEVLPAVAVRLGDEFGLSRFAVELLGEQGELVDVFALGGRPRATDVVRDLATAPIDELPANTAARLPLRRAGRTIGRLTFVAHRPLGQAQLAALSAAADLIAVASYNVELYEREQASVQRLRELDQLKDAFLSTISHELRTPLTAISGFVRLLRDRWGQLREDQRLEFLERVHGNTLSLGLLVDDLLDFARLERQALNAPPSPIPLDQQVATTLGQLEPVLGDRRIVSDLEPVLTMANAGALERVLANLLTNAAKFSPSDSTILVRVRRGDGHGVLEVIDEGAGIAPEDRERVFTRFYRGESDAARGTRGAGIGLSVVRELVTQMGGTVHAQPNVPRGTQMVVSLPLADPSPGAVPVPEVSPATAQRSRS